MRALKIRPRRYFTAGASAFEFRGPISELYRSKVSAYSTGLSLGEIRKRFADDAWAALRLHVAGGTPFASLNARVKWAWSEKPQLEAISLSDRDELRSKSVAFSMRLWASHRCGVSPVDILNALAK